MYSTNKVAQHRAVTSTPLLLLALCAVGCGGDDNGADAGADADGEDLSEALFDREHLIEVEVELDDADWIALRGEGRSLPDVFTGCARDFEYTYFGGRVTVDGEAYDNVGVRKKGFLGSLSTHRPSLKLNFGKFEPEQTHADMKRMTLNNDRQDPSHSHQCMAYDLFRAAGAVAPRCNYAHVVVNGEDLGIYSHIESVKKPMLRRHFESDDGNLYEGQGGDFTEVRQELLELKTNETENDRGDLQPIIDALQVDDDTLIDALGAVVDIDAFITFWAAEVLAGHWDSYSGGPNNFLTYHDPTSDKFFFIPWGTDGAFSQQRIFTPQNTAASVLAEGAIANRLYNHADGRRMYFDRLRSLLDDVWDEDALIEQAEWIGAFTGAPADAIDAQTQAIRDLGADIERELGEQPVEWVSRGVQEIELMCYGQLATPISGTFETTWNSMGSSSPNNGVDIAVMDAFDTGMLLAGASPDSMDPAQASIVLLTPRPGGRFLVLLLVMPMADLVTGVHAMHGFETNGMLVDIDPQRPGDFRLLGFAGDGTITLDAVGSASGDPVQGSFEGRFVQIMDL